MSGWAGIEDFLLKNDTSMVKGYAGDIDTLLVFVRYSSISRHANTDAPRKAGLFAAVLTAFVVQTYTLLQVGSDYTTNQLLAYQVSSQAPAASIPPSVNSTITRMLSPQPPSPTASARWINCLFFSSLVLALAAAFFGIVAKQWIREYMEWHSPLATSRDNVLLCQIRFEAWEAWRVVTTIACIPVLLEVAMILFLAGVVILLWTLDEIVAILVTSVAISFLGIAVAFTVLPVFVKRCPYKSPTAWVCVAGLGILSSACSAAAKLCATVRVQVRFSWSSPVSTWKRFIWVVRTFEKGHRVSRLGTWRERDLLNSRVGICETGWSRSTTREHILAAAKAELAEEKMHVPNAYAPGLPPANSRTVNTSYRQLQITERPPSQWSGDNESRAFLVELNETAVLLRALLWVQRATQDARVDRFVEECLESVHSREGSTASPFYRSLRRHILPLVDWSITLAFKNNSLAQPHVSLLSSMSDRGAVSSEDSISRLRALLGIHVLADPQNPENPVFVRASSRSQRLNGFLQLPWNSPSYKLLFRLLAVRFRQSLAELQREVEQEGTSFADPGAIHLHVRRIWELFSAAMDMGANSALWSTTAYLRVLQAVLCCTGALKDLLDAQAPGLRYLAFEMARMHTKLSVTASGNLCAYHFLLLLPASAHSVSQPSQKTARTGTITLH